MANVKEQSAALKSRQTKLLKKSKEELIEVILRKDKIEKNQVNQISNLKGEINTLQSRIKGFIADSEGDNNTICELREKLANANDLNKAQRGILIVDEIDKKAGGNGNEKVATTGVLEALLKLMEGGIYNFEYQKGRTIPFDTTNMTFVAMGAFSGLKNIANPKPPVGFNSHEVKEKNPFTTDNFDKFGLLPEFIGRCN